MPKRSNGPGSADPSARASGIVFCQNSGLIESIDFIVSGKQASQS
jgi:hypothetical protein